MGDESSKRTRPGRLDEWTEIPSRLETPDARAGRGYRLAIPQGTAHHAGMSTGSLPRRALQRLAPLLAALPLVAATPALGSVQGAGDPGAPDLPAEPATPISSPLTPDQERSLETLAALHDSLESKRAELRDLRAAYDPSVDSELRLQQLEEIRELQAEINRLAFDFESIATGIDLRTFEGGSQETELNLVEELTQFISPILTELRKATESPRELDRLRKLRETLQGQEEEARLAIANVDLSARQAPQGPLRDALLSSLETWRGRLGELENARTVAEFQLERHEESRESVYDNTRAALADFFRTRGLHILLALAAFVGILLGQRGLYKLLRRALPHLSKEDRPFYTRLVDVLYFAFSGLLAVAGALLVLYSAGDWALLGLAILGLLGLGWASKTALPIFFEQINILLNLGTVRESERVLVNGLPFRVAKISLNAELVNPALMGGKLRVPLRDLPNLRSRRAAREEVWFPTAKGNWVLWEGTRLAQVEQQTLEHVRLCLLGGNRLNVPTTEFLASGAENLSRGFRIEQRFGVDYEHQAISTTEIPAAMTERVGAALRGLTEEGQLVRVTVELLEAGASSLDYAVLCDLEGGAAPRYEELDRAVQATLVDLCTERGWGIPFTQVTLHGVPTP